MTGIRSKAFMVGMVIAAAIGLAVTMGVFAAGNKETQVSTEGSGQQASQQELRAAAQMKVFFGHQSVGLNVLDGVPLVYSASGVAAPPIVETTDPPAKGGYFAHAFIGENTKPFGKIEAFDKMIRGGVGDQVDVAFMKFCYVDITGETDVNALFAEYQKTMEGLKRDYPKVDFLYVTTPLTTEPSLKARVKALLGRPYSGPQDNAAREQFNALVRQAYGDTGKVFDIAAVESTSPDGMRVAGSTDGEPYYALFTGFASDEGHLNPTGSASAADELVRLVAAQSTETTQ